MKNERPQKTDLLVFITRKETACAECGQELWRHAFITLRRDKGALCLSCADLDHLFFLPAGDPCITRRAKKYSNLHAVVLKWSRARKRYERQGLLLEMEAVERAEKECLEDSEARARKRERDAQRRQEQDQQYVRRFAQRIRELYPGCPDGTEHRIAEHACMKYSGRVGRSAAAKALSEEAITLAVVAHIRHAETEYDELLMQGYSREIARLMVAEKVDQILEGWRYPQRADSPAGDPENL